MTLQDCPEVTFLAWHALGDTLQEKHAGTILAFSVTPEQKGSLGSLRGEIDS